ncbi:DUF1036 domain-containing protein [Epibacterium sp. MM17-32]|uniref:DUF1036 domain-containing protein n=1 Tax=Epibacterium sp. MM17-32 TaxID=2917734 RepID=UPI001EF4FC03|nr:DUF1036 domain-containing protein [Epibacterium sp. MM17-32]MCG7630479.1 DUF1036 domain-containing protein [Epibacterium sp. MM17-32]
MLKIFNPMALMACGVGVILLGTGTAARAAFTFCNQTLDVANVAIASYEDGGFESAGWWVVGPNQCAEVISQRLTSRFVYVFAKDVFGRALLDGATPMCVDQGRFSIRGEGDCLTRGFLDARFHEVDTQQSDSWSFFLRSARD